MGGTLHARTATMAEGLVLQALGDRIQTQARHNEDDNHGHLQCGTVIHVDHFSDVSLGQAELADLDAIQSLP